MKPIVVRIDENGTRYGLVASTDPVKGPILKEIQRIDKLTPGRKRIPMKSGKIVTHGGNFTPSQLKFAECIFGSLQRFNIIKRNERRKMGLPGLHRFGKEPEL